MTEIINPGDGGQPIIHLDEHTAPPFWRDLTDVCCSNCSSDEDPCKGRRFRTEIRVKKWEKIRIDNPFQKTMYYKMFVDVCVDCGTEIYYVDEDPYKNSTERSSKSLM